MPRGVYIRKSKPIEQRFWENVIKGKKETDCWGWKGYKHNDGYGILTVRRRLEKIHYNVYAHRLSWEIHHGPIPEGLFVCHHCDNPECTNPNTEHHLYLDDNWGNMLDASEKGRLNVPGKSNPGSLNGNAILNEELVRYIRESKVSAADLAAEIGVSKSLIWQIRGKRAWKHVT